MEIWVTYDSDRRTLTTIPMHARVVWGTPVSWRFQATGVLRQKLKWEIYFNEDTPFPGQFALEASSVSDGQDQHLADTEAQNANTPRDDEYKYGVRLSDEATEEELADDDPYILVRFG